MANTEHLLTIVEPTTGGDTTLDVARDVISRGGRASVVMVITDRVRRDIEAFAKAEGLDPLAAEGIALHRLHERYSTGGEVATHFGPLGAGLVQRLAADATSIAIPEGLLSRRLVERVVAASGRPVIVAPARRAA